MKISIYQFLCLGGLDGGGSTKIQGDRLFTNNYLYASTRDFAEFERIRYDKGSPITFSLEVYADREVGELVNHASHDNYEKCLKPVMIWRKGNCRYIGVLFKQLHPLIVELLPDKKWIRVLYSHDKLSLNDFVLNFKSDADFETQSAIVNAKCRLNTNIALGDVDIPGLYPSIF
ncbi:MAG: hypothetical protein M3O71_21615 [Bacteroidota bacterium]|nr:hypothetical protein [Bacteroidota bacterium]